ncbi:MAG: hypothetical protein MPJ24_10100, partial [Pirellulaceae bacterium]|nr:hypothetical protein [Pirellulaceae bacterium]
NTQTKGERALLVTCSVNDNNNSQKKLRDKMTHLIVGYIHYKEGGAWNGELTERIEKVGDSVN